MGWIKCRMSFAKYSALLWLKSCLILREGALFFLFLYPYIPGICQREREKKQRQKEKLNVYLILSKWNNQKALWLPISLLSHQHFLKLFCLNLEGILTVNKFQHVNNLDEKAGLIYVNYLQHVTDTNVH